MKTQIMTITPAMAKEMLKKNTNNRPLRIRLADAYAVIMKRGEWKLTHQGIAFDVKGNLIDGQTRLTALVKSGTNVQMVVATDCDPQTFKFLDIGKKRSPSDIFFIEGVKNSVSITSGIAIYINLLNNRLGTSSLLYSSITPALIMDEYYKEKEFFDNVATFAKSVYQQTRLISTSHIFGFISYAVLKKRHNIYDVFSFVRAATTGEDKLGNFNSALILFKMLIKNTLSIKKITTSDRMKLLIRAFNNDYKKETNKRLLIPTQHIDVIEAKQPKIIW